MAVEVDAIPADRAFEAIVRLAAAPALDVLVIEGVSPRLVCDNLFDSSSTSTTLLVDLVGREGAEGITLITMVVLESHRPLVE